MFMTYLREITDFTKINEPNDLICQTDPQKAIDNYNKLLEYSIETLIHVEKGEFLKKKKESEKKQLAEAITTLQKLPKDLSPEDKNHYSERIFKLQENKCAK